MWRIKNTNYTQNSAFTVHTLVRSQWAIAGSSELGQHRLLSFLSLNHGLKSEYFVSKKLLYVARQRALYVNHGAYSPVWPSRIEVHIQVRLGHGKHKSTTQTALARIHYETWSNLRL